MGPGGLVCAYIMKYNTKLAWHSIGDWGLTVRAVPEGCSNCGCGALLRWQLRHLRRRMCLLLRRRLARLIGLFTQLVAHDTNRWQAPTSLRTLPSGLCAVAGFTRNGLAHRNRPRSMQARDLSPDGRPDSGLCESRLHVSNAHAEYWPAGTRQESTHAQRSSHRSRGPTMGCGNQLPSCHTSRPHLRPRLPCHTGPVGTATAWR